MTNNIAYGETIGSWEKNFPSLKATSKNIFGCLSLSETGNLVEIFVGLRSFHSLNPTLYCLSALPIEIIYIVFGDRKNIYRLCRLK